MNDEDKPQPADAEVLPWLILAFIVLMLSLMAINTWL